MLKELIQIQKNYYFKPTRPIMAVLYITSKCNLRCGFCEMGGNVKSSSRDITSDELKEILRQLSDWGINKLYVTGGEPFVRRDIWDTLSYCHEKGMQVVRLTTNGTLLEHLSQTQIEILKRSVYALCISLDSAESKLHNKIRGVEGTYERIFTFLKSYPRNQLPDIYFSVVLTKNNFNQIGDIISLAHAHGVTHVNFQPLNFESNFPDYETKEGKATLAVEIQDLSLIEDTIRDGIKLANRLHVSTNLDVLILWIREYFQNANSSIYFFSKILKSHVCSKPFNYIHINYYGELLACSMIKTDKNIVGKDIKITWQDLAIQYKELTLKKQYFKFCHSCFCDFPTNFRESLLYHPIDNFRPLMKLSGYYLNRILFHQ